MSIILHKRAQHLPSSILLIFQRLDFIFRRFMNDRLRLSPIISVCRLLGAGQRIFFNFRNCPKIEILAKSTPPSTLGNEWLILRKCKRFIFFPSAMKNVIYIFKISLQNYWKTVDYLLRSCILNNLLLNGHGVQVIIFNYSNIHA